MAYDYEVEERITIYVYVPVLTKTNDKHVCFSFSRLLGPQYWLIHSW